MPASTTLDHITIVSDDFEASRPVYDAVLGALGLAPRLDYEDPEADSDDTGTVAAIGYGHPLWLSERLMRFDGLPFDEQYEASRRFDAVRHPNADETIGVA